MPKVFLLMSLPILAAIGLLMTGCSKQQTGQQPSPSPTTSQSPPAAAEHAGQEEAERGEARGAEHAAGAVHNEYETALAALSPEDRALAEKQKICPVSGQPLGSMGTPVKVTVQGREVLLCCPGCEAAIKADPEKYLAKLAP